MCCQTMVTTRVMMRICCEGITTSNSSHRRGEALHDIAELVREGMEKVGNCGPRVLPVFVSAAKQPKHHFRKKSPMSFQKERMCNSIPDGLHSHLGGERRHRLPTPI